MEKKAATPGQGYLLHGVSQLCHAPVAQVGKGFLVEGVGLSGLLEEYNVTLILAHLAYKNVPFIKYCQFNLNYLFNIFNAVLPL